MKEKMNNFLNELGELLKKHNTAIVRSANSTNDLVISLQEGADSFYDLTFPEEVSESSIRNEWYY